MQFKQWTTASLLTALFFAYGCGEDGEDQTQSTEPTTQTRQTVQVPDTEYNKGVKIYDNVKAIDSSAMGAIQKNGQDELVIRDSELAQKYKVGDVLVSDVGDGLFRVVENIEQSTSGEVLFKTRPAQLVDAVAEGQIYLAKLTEDSKLTPPEEYLYAPSSSEMVQGQNLGFEKGWEGSIFSYNKDFGPQLTQAINDPHFQVTAATVNAEIGAEAYAKVKAKLSFSNPLKIERAKLAANGTANATLRVKLISDDTFDYDKTFKIVGDPSTNPMVAVPRKEHTLLPGIFPLKFIFDVNADLNVKASIKGKIDAEVGYTVASFVQGGVERKNDKWTWISSKEFDGKLYGPKFTGEKNFSASAKLTTSLKLSVGERASGYIDFQPVNAEARVSQDINADTGQCPTKGYLNANGQVKGEFKWIDIPLIGKKSFDVSKDQELYNVTPVDFTKQLNLPAVCDPNYMPANETGTVGHGRACGGANECISNICYSNTCVREGKLRISMNWQGGNSDFDLYVKDPTGEVTSYKNLRSGIAIYDFSTCTNECPDGRPAVESVFFPSDAPDGEYEIWVVNERADGATEAKFEIDLDGNVSERTLAVPDQKNAQSQSFKITIKGGQIQ